MGKIILITGASSGFGYDAAKMLKEKGHIVYALARRIEKLNELKELGINIYKLDVTDYIESKRIVDEIIKKEGRIDILINNAGYGELGPIEMVSIDDAKYQMEVNVFSLANMCKLVIPSMRENKKGRIINISSIAGRITTYFGGWYNISKYSVEALSDSLRLDLKKFNIDVTMIEPGPFKTNWGIIASDKLLKSTKDSAYENDGIEVANFYKYSYSHKNFLVKDGIIVSKKICNVALKKHVKARYLVGRFSHSMVFFSKILPTRLLDKIIMKTKRKK